MIIRAIKTVSAIITTEWHEVIRFQKEKGFRYLLRVLFLPVCIPILLITIHYAVLRGIKSQYTIFQYVYLNYSSPNMVSVFFSNYAHNLQNVSHLMFNIIYFEIIIIPILILNYYLFPIHAIRFSKKFFKYSCFLTFILGPFIISGLSLYFGRMLNYEIGVGFSGINWAFAGLLFFLIISVMFRYLKKNTICGDALITIHAGIVVISFVMFFPVCVILSSIKYGGTNVFAHMSGYLFGWLTFPMLAFFLEVSERKKPCIRPSPIKTSDSSELRRNIRHNLHLTGIRQGHVLLFRNSLYKRIHHRITSRILRNNNEKSYISLSKETRPLRKRLSFLSDPKKQKQTDSNLPSGNNTVDITKKKQYLKTIPSVFLFSYKKKTETDIPEFSFNIEKEIKTHRKLHFLKKDILSVRKRKNRSQYVHILSKNRFRKNSILSVLKRNKQENSNLLIDSNCFSSSVPVSRRIYRFFRKRKSESGNSLVKQASESELVSKKCIISRLKNKIKRKPKTSINSDQFSHKDTRFSLHTRLKCRIYVLLRQLFRIIYHIFISFTGVIRVIISLPHQKIKQEETNTIDTFQELSNVSIFRKNNKIQSKLQKIIPQKVPIIAFVLQRMTAALQLFRRDKSDPHVDKISSEILPLPEEKEIILQHGLENINAALSSDNNETIFFDTDPRTNSSHFKIQSVLLSPIIKVRYFIQQIFSRISHRTSYIAYFLHGNRKNKDTTTLNINETIVDSSDFLHNTSEQQTIKNADKPWFRKISSFHGTIVTVVQKIKNNRSKKN